MSKKNKIKVNDLPDEKTQEEAELPVINEDNNRGGHSEGGCCGACGDQTLQIPPDEMK